MDVRGRGNEGSTGPPPVSALYRSLLRFRSTIGIRACSHSNLGYVVVGPSFRVTDCLGLPLEGPRRVPPPSVAGARRRVPDVSRVRGAARGRARRGGLPIPGGPRGAVFPPPIPAIRPCPSTPHDAHSCRSCARGHAGRPMSGVIHGGGRRDGSLDRRCRRRAVLLRNLPGSRWTAVGDLRGTWPPYR